MQISEPKIVTTEEISLIGYARDMHLLNMQIPALWQEFRSHPMVRNKNVPTFYSVQRYHEPVDLKAFSPTALFTKWATAPSEFFDTTPEGMEVLVVPGGLYAQFEVQAPPTAAKEVFGHIYGQWLPQSGYQLAHRHQVEVIPHDYIQQGDNAKEIIWIPIAEM
jgi:AraC family transcriptional regulator